MRGIQKNWLLIAIVALGLAACSKPEPEPEYKTVAQHLHDIDGAKAAIKKYAQDKGKYSGTPDYMNASQANHLKQFMGDCWPQTKSGTRFTTANTNHACLDAKGYKV